MLKFTFKGYGLSVAIHVIFCFTRLHKLKTSSAHAHLINSNEIV